MDKTVLVIDDNEDIMWLLHDSLSLAGFRVAMARNGREGLFAARHEVPDLVLLNVVMPNMNGYDFLRVFRQEYDTPVILVSAKADETDIMMGFELGADDYVTKPFSVAELIDLVYAHLFRVD